MNPYSGISSYEIGDEYIRVRFSKKGDVFTYSYNRAGHTHVENMKELAKRGRGLNTYINQYVKNLYD